jgi:hypothetical protein
MKAKLHLLTLFQGTSEAQKLRSVTKARTHVRVREKKNTTCKPELVDTLELRRARRRSRLSAELEIDFSASLKESCYDSLKS